MENREAGPDGAVPGTGGHRGDVGIQRVGGGFLVALLFVQSLFLGHLQHSLRGRVAEGATHGGS